MSPKQLFSSSHLPLFILGLAVYIGFFSGIGSMPLFDLDEGAFTTATREMFLRQDFITPYLNAVPRFDKPILIYWLQAASAAVFGFNEFAFRLPSALASAITVGVVYRFAAGVVSREVAFFAALMLATGLISTVVGKAAIADAVLMLFLTLSQFAVFKHWQTGRAAYIRWAYVAMALGFLTKGPVALLIPGVVSALFYVSTGRWSIWWRAVLDGRGLLLFLVIALPWYVLEYAHQGQAFIDGFFLKNNIGRFSAPMEGHSGGFWFYPVVAVVGILPFTGALFLALRHIRDADWRHGQADSSPLTALRWFGWLWFVFVLVFFSFSGTKLPHYLNYGMVGLMLVLATYLPSIHHRGLHVLPVLIFWGLLLALPSLVDEFFDRIHPLYVQQMLADRAAVFGWGWYVPLGVFLLMGLWTLFDRRRSLPMLLVPLALAFSWSVNGLVVPAVAELQQAPIRAAGLLARDLPGPALMYRMNTPSFGVYAGKILKRGTPQPGDLVLTRAVYAGELDAKVLFSQGGVVLLRMQ
ncbi:ArnT family glycosyltransferase [Halothiobacillus sp. DCM-1]|uniref:ArnT family glycosyltransferase n=1 Tax=Halothiobacillus sp. DCM-1 TaxID=3112558 RepID=UPI00324C77AE